MQPKFKRYDFKFSDVKPSDKDLADFLQLDLLDEDHPALVFLDEILPSLDNLGHIHGGYQLFDIVSKSSEGITLTTNNLRQTANGKLLTANGKWQTANGKWQTANGKWQTANGKWQTANGKLLMANGKLQTANGKLQTANGKQLTANGKLQTAESVSFELGKQVCGYLKGSEIAALFICTAGEEFNSLIDHFNSNGDLLEAYLVDAIGSLTVENAMDRIMDQLEEEWIDQNYKITNRYSPGYCNWHLAEQHKLFQLIEGHATNIQLTESSLMMPTKSVSGIIGIGREARKRDYGCSTCNNATCIYRKILQKT